VDELNASANEIVEGEIVRRLRQVETILDSDVISYFGSISDQMPDVFKYTIESIGTRRAKIAVLLETNGGYIESAERVANTLRHHYETVEWIVTSYAMSAGTVLVMSGDAIHMDYSATLGPIDPQWRRPGSEAFVPALGYLQQYKRLIKKSAKGQLTTAELAYLLDKFDPGELYQFEQARDLSIALLEQWLVAYKFKNWTETSDRKLPVTLDMKKVRAREIAKILNDTRRWYSHNRGISMEILRSDLKLMVDDIDTSPELGKAVAGFNRLLYDYRVKRGHHYFVVCCSEGYHGH